MSRRVAGIVGTITFDDGETVEFGLGDEVDWRSGNRTDVLGDAVDVTTAINQALLDEELYAFQSDLRECSRCGEEVSILNSDDECLGCEEERASFVECDECPEKATNFWPNLKEPVKLCASCTHNARRSGWGPGQ